MRSHQPRPVAMPASDQAYLSLHDVADLMEEALDQLLAEKVPRPELHSPEQPDKSSNSPTSPGTTHLFSTHSPGGRDRPCGRRWWSHRGATHIQARAGNPFPYLSARRHCV